MQKLKIFEDVEIRHLDKKGDGNGVYCPPSQEMKEVVVPFAIPGDVVDVQVFKKQRKKNYAKINSIKKPSEERIEPKCLHFGVCGGCRWQQMEYSTQLKYKNEFIYKIFSSLCSSSQIKPTIGCELPWHYRNKMEFSFSCDIHQQKFLGLIMNSTRGKVFNLTECHLVNSWFAEAVKNTRQWWHETGLEAYRPNKDQGSLRTLTVREGHRTGDRMIILTVSGNADYALQKRHLESFVAYMRDGIEPYGGDAKLSIFLRIQQIAKGMPTNFYEMLLYGPDHIREILHIQTNKEQPSHSLTFTISPSAFFQPNSFKAEQIYSLAIQMAELTKDAIVYDLYCGTGTLSICMAPYVKQVIGVEISPESALDAKTNAANNGIKNVTIMTGAVRHLLNQIKDDPEISKPDVVFIDPPRPGLDPEALLSLIELNPPKIIYISCNPQTQFTNVQELVAHGYELKEIQPVDQFPHTAHVENIVLLHRK